MLKQDQLFNKKQLAEAKARHVINDIHIHGRSIANTIIQEEKIHLSNISIWRFSSKLSHLRVLDG